jgi:tRNA nucleotidyltransferase (CCA-adding enzyme)
MLPLDYIFYFLQMTATNPELLSKKPESSDIISNMENMELTTKVPPQVLFILQTLADAGFEAYIVGGAVRDLILRRESNYDFDFTTSARPEEILELFPDAFYENNFGTVMITDEDLREQTGIAETKDSQNTTSNSEEKPNQPDEKKRIIDLARASKIHESLAGDMVEDKPKKPKKVIPNYEITTFRSDGAYEDHRHPEKVEWGKDLKEDLERRDFTINALALKLLNSKSGSYEVLDFHQGKEDLDGMIIKTVGDPNLRFKEDALRIMRAVRFSVQLNMEIEVKTFAAIVEHSNLIEHVSWERISDEFMKIMASDFPAEGIEILDEVGLLQYIMPETLEGKGVEQGGHHNTDVWTHNLEALRTCPSKDPVVRLAAFLHDVAKPRTYKEIDGKVTAYNHEIVGSRIASKIAKRLKFSKKNVARIFTLVRFHMFHYQPKNSDASIRRFMRKVGLENVDDILDLREGDRLGSGARQTSWRLEEMKKRMIEQLNQPLEVTDLVLNGKDLMKNFDLKPGKILGEILEFLFEKVLEDASLNTREKLLRLSEEYLDSIEV